jgi:hypothetical protein
MAWSGARRGTPPFACLSRREAVRPSPDLVAVLLCVALLLAVAAIGAALVANVALGHDPATLGENSTQVLTAVVGGLVGVLGSYLGARRRPPE